MQDRERLFITRFVHTCIKILVFLFLKVNCATEKIINYVAAIYIGFFLFNKKHTRLPAGQK